MQCRDTQTPTEPRHTNTRILTSDGTCADVGQNQPDQSRQNQEEIEIFQSGIIKEEIYRKRFKPTVTSTQNLKLYTGRRPQDATNTQEYQECTSSEIHGKQNQIGQYRGRDEYPSQPPGPTRTFETETSRLDRYQDSQPHMG